MVCTCVTGRRRAGVAPLTALGAYELGFLSVLKRIIFYIVVAQAWRR